MIKLISKQYMLNKDLLDSWQLAKYVSLLHSHPSTIKGDFGLQKELELLIERDLNRNVLKFEHLIKLSDHIFANNIGSNEMQGKIEKLICKKIKDRVNIDMTRFIKLVENISSYRIKNRELCDGILGYLIENIKYKSQVPTDYNTNEETLFKYDEDNEKINNLDDGSDNSVVLNIERSNNYIKLTGKLNIIIWAVTKNEFFSKLINEEPEYQHFFSLLKEKFFENLYSFKDREFIISLNSICLINSDFFEKISQQNKTSLIERISSINNASPHDLLILLKITNIIGNLNLINEVSNKISNVYENLFYKDLIGLIEYVNEMPEIYDNNFKLSLVKIYEKRVIKLLKDIEIKDFCRVIMLLEQRFSWSNIFLENVKLHLKNRINEIPKEYFLGILETSVNMRLSEIDVQMLDILNELSSYQNINEYFNLPTEKLNLYWSCLNIYQITKDQKVKDTILNIIGLNNEFSLENNVLIKELLSIDITTINNQFDLFLSKYLQSFYLFFLILKQKSVKNIENILYDVNKLVSRNVLNITLVMREKFISQDAASTVDKDIFNDISNCIINFMNYKKNASIYQNFIDEFFNPIHFAIVFEIPKLKKNEKIISEIDNKKYAILIINNNFKDTSGKLKTIYENRSIILKEIFEWEVIELEEEIWKKLNLEEKLELLRLKFGFEFKSLEDAKIRIAEDGKSNIKLQNLEETKKIQPKYNLTKDIFNKKNKL